MADAWNGSWGVAWGISWGTTVAPVSSSANWDTSDPVFYDWWRKRAEERSPEIEPIAEIAEVSLVPEQAPAEALRLLNFQLGQVLARMPPPMERPVTIYDQEQDDEEAILVLMAAMQ